MPADLFNRGVDLDLFYPPFLERLLIAKARARARGADMLCTFGFRTCEESDQLYAKFLAGGPRAAPGGKSSHNFGLASDECLIIETKPKRIVRWGDRDFDIFAGEAGAVGLHWGVAYKDKPHFSWPGFVSADELAPLRKIWRENEGLKTLQRLQKVWLYVDSHSPAMPEVSP